MGKNLKQWDMILPQIEFSYNCSLQQSIGMSPFEVVYGVNPIGLLDLLPYPTKKQFSRDANERVKVIKKLYELVRASIEKQNERYLRVANKHRKPMEFNVVDSV